LKNIEQLTKKKITKMPIPTYDDVIEGIQQASKKDVIDAIGKNDYDEYKLIAEQLLDEYPSIDVVAATLKLLSKEPKESVTVKLSDVSPLRVKKAKNRDGGRHERNRNGRSNKGDRSHRRRRSSGGGRGRRK